MIETRLTDDVAAPPLFAWRVYQPSQVEEALARWRDIERQLGSDAVTCSATWTECWIQNYGAQVRYRIQLAIIDEVPRGICLLTEGVDQKEGPVPVRTLHLGTAGEPSPGSVCVEYNKLLVHPDYREQIIRSLATLIQKESWWEQFRIDGATPEELELWQELFPGAAIRTRDSKYFDLEAVRRKGEEILPQLGKSTRSNIKRRLKQYGDIETDWASTPDEALDIFDELVTLHQARWQAVGQPGAFAPQAFHSFQRDLCVRLFLENRIVLFRVRSKGSTVGCLMLLVDENRLLDYLSGFASFEEHPSPGLISHYLCMNEALVRGYRAYDFLVGEKQHKDNLSTQIGQLCWFSWSRPSLKLSTVSWLRSIKQTLQRFRRSGLSKSSSSEKTS